MKKWILLGISHSVFLALGFALGVYLLPILIAPDSPKIDVIEAAAKHASYKTTFEEKRGDSDGFHWAEGEVFVSAEQIVFKGKMAPGPDYKLYLSPKYIETEEAFLGGIKDQSVRVDVVKAFNGFIIKVPQGIDIENYNTVVIWCEQFKEYISSAKYR